MKETEPPYRFPVETKGHVCFDRRCTYSMIVLFHFLQPLLLSAAVARSVIRRLESFGASLRVFDNFNGAESPWVRLVALLDLSETRPLSATADSLKSIGLADTHFSKAQNRGNSSFWAVSPMLKSLGNAYA